MAVDALKETMKEVKTKADKIRHMTDEELAEEFIDFAIAFYSVEWSKQDVLEMLQEEIQ